MITRRQMLLSAACLALSPCARAAAGDVRLESAVLTLDADDASPGYSLSADWSLTLPDVLLESLQRGILLYFTYEFRLQRSRWYWTDRTVLHASFTQWVGYSPLSRQYRLSRGGLTQSFARLEDAVPLLRHVRDWRVAGPEALEDPEDLQAEVRMRLDLSRLPKPLQVTVGGNSDWLLESDWEEFPLPAAPGSS